MAITWQNINAPDSSQSLRSLVAAQQSVDSALSTLGNLLKGAESIANFNAGVVRGNNTEEALNSIYAYLKPEDLNAAIASGGLQQVIQNRFGDNIDKAAVRKMLDTRPTVLMEQDVAQDNYQENQRVRAEKPLYDSILAEAYKDPNKGLELARNFQGFQKPELLGKVHALQRDARDAEYKANEDARAATRLELEQNRDGREATRLRKELDILDRQAELIAANDAADIEVQKYHQDEMNFYDRIGRMMKLGKPYNPLTATQAQREQFKRLTEDKIDATTGKVIYKALVPPPDPDAYAAQALRTLKSSLNPRQYAAVQPGLAARFTSSVPLSGQSSALINKKTEQLQAQVENYRRSGAYGDSVDVYGTPTIMDAARNMISQVITENNASKPIAMWGLDPQEVADTDIFKLLQEGLIVKVFDEKTKKEKMVRYDFPLQEVKIAIDSLRGGDEQAAEKYLRKFQTSFKEGNAADKDTLDAKIRALQELHEYQQNNRTLLESMGVQNLKEATKDKEDNRTLLESIGVQNLKKTTKSKQNNRTLLESMGIQNLKKTTKDKK